MKRLLLKSAALLSAALFTVGCSQDNTELDNSVVESTDLISFNPSVSTVTKGLVTDNQGDNAVGSVRALEVSGFGIMAYNTKTESWATAGAATLPNVMYDTQVTKPDGSTSWIYSPKKYWNVGHNYSFFAYAPYNNELIKKSANNVAGAPSINFSISSSPADMLDFVASAVYDKTSDSGAVDFSFNHELSRLSLSALTAFGDNTTAVVKVNSIEILHKNSESPAFFTHATYNYAAVGATAAIGTWSDAAYSANDAAATADTYSLASVINPNNSITTSNNSVTTAAKIFADNQYLFMIPVDGGTTADNNITFSINYTVSDNGTSYDYTSEFSLGDGCLKQGKAYNVALTFSSTLSTTAIVVPWSEENGTITTPEPDVTPKVPTKENPFHAPEYGYFDVSEYNVVSDPIAAAAATRADDNAELVALVKKLADDIQVAMDHECTTFYFFGKANKYFECVFTFYNMYGPDIEPADDQLEYANSPLELYSKASESTIDFSAVTELVGADIHVLLNYAPAMEPETESELGADFLYISWPGTLIMPNDLVELGRYALSAVTINTIEIPGAKDITIGKMGVYDYVDINNLIWRGSKKLYISQAAFLSSDEFVPCDGIYMESGELESLKLIGAGEIIVTDGAFEFFDSELITLYLNADKVNEVTPTTEDYTSAIWAGTTWKEVIFTDVYGNEQDIDHNQLFANNPANGKFNLDYYSAMDVEEEPRYDVQTRAAYKTDGRKALDADLMAYIATDGNDCVTFCGTYNQNLLGFETGDNLFKVSSSDTESLYKLYIDLTKVTSLTTIADRAFYEVNDVKEIYLPESVQSIGYYAFKGDDFFSLSSIDAPGVTHLSRRAFYEAETLESIYMPLLQYIGENALDGTSITSANFPCLTGAGKQAFDDCIKLVSVNLPILTNIAEGMFDDCVSLTSVKIPEARIIGKSAFVGCGVKSSDDPEAGPSGLMSVSFPKVETVGYYAFSCCYALQSVSLPAATNIGGYVFQCCPLTSLDLSAEGVTEGDVDGYDVFGYFTNSENCALTLATDVEPTQSEPTPDSGDVTYYMEWVDLTWKSINGKTGLLAD